MTNSNIGHKQDHITLTDRRVDFSYFDRLKPEVKQKLNEAKFPFNAKIAFDAQEKLGVQSTIALICNMERKIINRGSTEHGTHPDCD